MLLIAEGHRLIVVLNKVPWKERKERGKGEGRNGKGKKKRQEGRQVGQPAGRLKDK